MEKQYQYNSVEEALEELRQGRIVLVTDDPDRENEGDMICAAEFATQENINFMANLLLGVIFIVIGNYLPKCRQNYTIGIKLPWTLSDTENWDRTHRFAGKIWMLCGVLEIIVGFLPIAQFEIVTIALILLATIPVAVYSYLLYRKKMG